MRNDRVPPAAVRTIHKHRQGQWWNKKLACRRRAAYLFWRSAQTALDGRCPLCGQQDGSGHTLLKCGDRQLQAMYTARHDAAVRLIMRTLQRQSRGGGCYTLMDAC